MNCNFGGSGQAGPWEPSLHLDPPLDPMDPPLIHLWQQSEDPEVELFFVNSGTETPVLCGYVARTL